MERMKTKDRILLAALDLFSEKGYDQTSIDLIAEAVGIKGPSIYAHYKEKKDRTGLKTAVQFVILLAYFLYMFHQRRWVAGLLKGEYQ